MFKKRNFIDFESAQYCKFAMDTTILDPILLIFIDFLPQMSLICNGYAAFL